MKLKIVIKMIDINAKLLKKFEELIEEGNNLIEIIDELNYNEHLNNQDLARINTWIMRCGHIIKSLCNNDEMYFTRFEEILDECNFSFIKAREERGIAVILGIINGLYMDYSSGLLSNVRNLMRGEIFVDFLDMGEHLLEEGYKDAAAVIIGAVLEDTLRKIALKNEIDIKKDNGTFKTINSLNQDIYKKKVYNSYIQKNITSSADLRNKAAHGHYDKYTDKEVKIMLLSVQEFCSKHLS